MAEEKEGTKRQNVVETLRRQRSKKDPCDISGDSKEDDMDLEEFDADANAQLIDNYLEASDFPYRCSSPTLGDGNCWWRAIADLLGMEDKDAHKILRRQVCENVKRCPKEWLETHTSLHFNDKPRGIKDFVYRQKKLGQYTDNKGIITQATAYVTQRNIHVFSVTGGKVPTVLEAGGKADSYEPLVVFFHGKHFQALVPFQGQQKEEK